MKITISETANCANENHCFKIGAKPEVKRAWIDRHELHVNAFGDVFTPVTAFDGAHFMDCITGSLYRNGRCLTSETLRTGLLTQDNKAGAKILFAKKIQHGMDA